MTLPMFPPGHDPGPNFNEVLHRLGFGPFPEAGPGGAPGAPTRAGGLPGGGPGMLTVPGGGDGRVPSVPFQVTHGTTICAVRYGDGVIMAGDRRATSGSAIAHRTMEKVHAADTHSGVAIAGAAGPAMEMVRIFQLQLEHYEKVEGQALSLEGKANQLSQMVRANLGMAMQGFVVVPLFAGYDLRRAKGRIYTYDPTGGRYEETDYHADGSGGRDARTTIKLGFRDDMSREEGIDLCVRALWQAADEDSATGGPDAVRGIFPTVATITAQGFERVPEAEVAQAFGRVISTLSSAEVNRTLPAADADADAHEPDSAGPSKAGATKATASKATAARKAAKQP
ncbi:MAG TPA: proteasome subunit beta [Acidimicrobiales bacterium]|nr:proteasome subunit beta [Acidimicrobiales bacterium]